MALRLLAGCALLDRMFDARSGVGQCLFERLDVQIVRARKVVVEAAMGQRQIAHQIADYGAVAAAAPEPARGGAHDAIVGLLFVFRGVASRAP